jgi:hypothetical protein
MSANFDDVPPERRAAVAQDIITGQRQQHARKHRRPSAMTARELLAAMHYECLLLWTAWANIRAGVALTERDDERITIAMARIDYLNSEVAR